MDSILKNKYRYYHINSKGKKVYKYGWGKNDAPPEDPLKPGEKIRKIDCSHLVNSLLKDYGYEIPFQNTDWLHRSKYYDIINPKDVKPGDLILWKEHVGVVESYDPGSISGTFFGSQRSTGPATAKFADRSKFKPKNPGDRPPYWQAPDLFLRPKPQYHRDNIPQKAQADSGEGSFDDDDDDGIPGTPGPTKMHFDGDGPSNYKSNIILTLFLNLFQNLYSSSGPESSTPGGSGPSPGGSGPGSRGPGSGPGSSGPGSSGPGSGPGGSGPGGSGPRPGSSGPKSGPGSERSRPGSERSNSQRSNQDRDWFRNTNDEFRQAREEEQSRRMREEQSRRAREEQSRRARDEQSRRAREEEQSRRTRDEEQSRRAREEEQSRRMREEQSRRAREEEQSRRAREEEQSRRAREEEQSRRTRDEQARRTREEEQSRRTRDEQSRRARDEEESRRTREEQSRRTRDEQSRRTRDDDEFRRAREERQSRRSREEESRRTHEESRRQEQNERSRSSSTPRYFASRPSDARKSTLGSWARPLRASVRYAASHVSPLVLDLNGDGIKLLPYTQGVFFDIDGDGFAERVGWITPEEGQLARDLNLNGRIDDITELFGDDLISAFFKLALLDSNRDQVIDRRDDLFRELLVWQDLNTNGFSEPEELKMLKEHGIQQISLLALSDNRTIEGNLITSFSHYITKGGAKHEIADVHYHNDDMDTWYQGKEEIAPLSSRDHLMIRQFRREIFEVLSDLLVDQPLTDPEAVGEKLEAEIKKVILEYEQRNIDAIEQKHKIVNDCLQTARQIHPQRCQQETVQLNERGNQAYARQKENRTRELRKEMTTKIKEEKERVHTQNDQIYQQKKQALSQKINEQLRQELAAIETPYRQEREREEKKIQEKYRREHTAAKHALLQEYQKTDKAETRAVSEEYRQFYERQIQEEGDQLKEKATKDLTQQIDMHQHACLMDAKRVGLVLGKEFSEYKKILTDRFRQYKEALEQETMQIAAFLLEKLEQFKDPDLSVVLSWSEEYEARIDAQDDQAEQDDQAAQDNQDEQGTPDAQDTQAPTVLSIPIGFQGTGKASAPTSSGAYMDIGEQRSQADNAVQTLKGDGYIPIDPETLLLPWSRGYGKMPSLHIAMTKNPKLKQDIMNFMDLKPSQWDEIHPSIAQILYEWANVSGIPEDARAASGGMNIEARKVAFIEQLTGQPFRQLGVAEFVGQHASTAVQKAWDIALVQLTQKLLVQGPFMTIFPNASYSFLSDQIHFNSPLDDILGRAQEFTGAYQLAYPVSYDFWVQLGYILVLNLDELQTTLSVVRARLSELAGQLIPLGLEPFSLVGDEGDNQIVGTGGSDYIQGLGGNDHLHGKNSSDHLDGGPGQDTLQGEGGIDRLHGGEDNDLIEGGGDRDFVYGEDGDDTIHGGEGDDHIEGGAGADIMDGGPGRNTLSYGSAEGVYVSLRDHVARPAADEQTNQTHHHALGDQFKNFQNLGGSEYADHLIGDDQDNEINGESGDDLLKGLGGNDHLFGAKGSDILLGGVGNDTLTAFEGPDEMDGEEGEDTVDYHHPYATRGVIVDLTTGQGQKGYADQDTYKNIEHVTGSKHDDILTGNAGNNLLQGAEGDDLIAGLEGNDVLFGGSGKDRLLGGAGNDKVLLIGDGDEADGGEGDNTVSYEQAREGVTLNLETGKGKTGPVVEDQFKLFRHAVGSPLDDEITGDHQANHLWGLGGDDILQGKGGNDVLAGGAGADVLHGGDGTDCVEYSASPEGVAVYLDEEMGEGGDAEGDHYIDIENVIGSKHDDILVGDVENNHLDGGEGDDTLQGDLGNDILTGGLGADLLDGGIGIDYASYQTAASGVEVNLTNGTGHGGEAEGDRYVWIEGVIGSKYDDILIGNKTQDFLEGREGNDAVYGREGDDVLSGGPGQNRLYGEDGDDIFYLEAGSNEVDGGSGNNTISYGRYRQKAYQAASAFYQLYLDQRLLPLYADDFFQLELDPKGVTVHLDTGDAQKQEGLRDRLSHISHIDGSNFNDQLWGNDENNHIRGFDGNDIIYGGAGHDVIVGGYGFNLVYGGPGNDQFIGSPGVEIIDGGEDEDAVTYRHSDTGVRVNLRTGVCDEGDATGDYLLNIENIETSEHDDVVFDAQGDNIISTGDGDDFIYLSDGRDLVYAGGGNDHIMMGGSGNKFIIGGEGLDSFVLDPSLKTRGPLGTLIVDFMPDGSERIDLSQFKQIRSFEDLVIKEMTQKSANLEMHPAVSHYLGNKKTVSCSVIELSAEQKIALWNVPASELSLDDFVFYEANAPMGYEV